MLRACQNYCKSRASSLIQRPNLSETIWRYVLSCTRQRTLRRRSNALSVCTIASTGPALSPPPPGGRASWTIWGVLYCQHTLTSPLMLPPNDRRVVRQLQGLDCLEVCKRSKGRDTHSDKCFRRCIVLCSGRLRMAELSTASISRRGVQKKSKTVKVPGRQRLPRQGIRHRSHRSMWLPNRTYTPGCCFTLVVRALVRALSMKRRTRQLIRMIPTHGGVLAVYAHARRWMRLCEVDCRSE